MVHGVYFFPGRCYILLSVSVNVNIVEFEVAVKLGYSFLFFLPDPLS